MPESYNMYLKLRQGTYPYDNGKLHIVTNNPVSAT